MKKVSSKMVSSNKFGGKYTVTHTDPNGEIISVNKIDMYERYGKHIDVEEKKINTYKYEL